MPTYEIECRACGKPDEFSSTIDERDKTPNCSECGAVTKRLISAVQGFVQFPAAGGKGYVSQTSGKYIDTARARRDDLKRTGCRPYEGFEQESKQAAKDRAHEEKKSDERLHDSVAKAYHELPPEKRAVLNA